MEESTLDSHRLKRGVQIRTQIPKSVEKNFAKCQLQILSADCQRKCNNLLAEYDGRLIAEIEQNLSLLGTRERVIFIGFLNIFCSL